LGKNLARSQIDLMLKGVGNCHNEAQWFQNKQPSVNYRLTTTIHRGRVPFLCKAKVGHILL
jgi:hypothetical protein